MEPLDLLRKIEALVAKHGKHVRLGWFRGWLSITEEKGCWSVMWTTGKDTHFALTPAFVVDYDKTTGVRYQRYRLSGVWRSALSMWPVRDQDEIDYYCAEMARLIQRAV